MKRLKLAVIVGCAYLASMVVVAAMSSSALAAGIRRQDPFGKLTVRVKWEGLDIVGISKVSGLTRRTVLPGQRGGPGAGLPGVGLPFGGPLVASGVTSFEPIILERPISSDHAFEEWADEVWNMRDGRPGVAAVDFHKDVIIDHYNRGNQKVLSYRVYRCWISEYQAVPEVSADGELVAVERITLQHEGWERDHDVVPPEVRSPTVDPGALGPRKPKIRGGLSLPRVRP
ncbi:MAG TPA: phage tail protein [Armatimonadota bacterium]|nr:phage tail protein [Armatimonadota bacterium]